MKIRSVMSPLPFHIDSTASLTEVLQQMQSMEIRHLPVMENDQIIGVLTQSEATLGQRICEATGYCPLAGEACREEPHIVTGNTELIDVVKDLIDRKITYVLVADDDADDDLIGIFTTTDAQKALVYLLEERASN